MVGHETEGPDSDVLYIPIAVVPTLPADLLKPPAPALPPGPDPNVPALTPEQEAELLPSDKVPPREPPQKGKALPRPERQISSVRYTAADLRALAAAWDDAVPDDARGMLAATVTNSQTNGAVH